MNPTPAKTLAALAGGAVLFAVMAVWGISAATSPVPEGTAPAPTGPTCAPEDQNVISTMARDEVTVSVYNTGERSGRAGDTLALLEAAGFKPGAVGNGQPGDEVAKVVVRTTKSDDPAAELVALAFGSDTPVVVTDDNRGPGVDVFIGDGFKRLAKNAPKKIDLADPIVTCIKG